MTFLITRLLADGIRVLAAAIPLKVILEGMGLDLSYFVITVILSVVTILYTFIGGITAVVWVDVVQMLLYVAGGILAIIVRGAEHRGQRLVGSGRRRREDPLFVLSDNPISGPDSFIASLIGGAVFAMASHGSDQLVVQRLLSCRSKAEAQKAIIVSGVVVTIQFAIFLVVGLALWGYYQQATPAELGLTRDDEIFPLFIVEALPPGLSGLLLAGILAAAMSTLSSSLSALTSTVTDVVAKLRRQPLSDAQGLRVGRWATIGWGLAFLAPATIFRSERGQHRGPRPGRRRHHLWRAAEGAFMLGIVNRRARAADANIAFVVAVAVNAFLFLMEKYVVGEVRVAWQWYPPCWA